MPNPDSTNTIRDIVFVDPTVPNYQSLIAGINPENVLIVLDPTRDGVEQISEALEGSSFESVHIVSHGTSGNLQLGTAQLNSETISTRYQNLLQQWSNSFAPGADILLYGCNVAQDESGKQFVQQLHQITGADIAASDDATGSIVLGGDWNLEHTTGSVSAPLAFQTGVLEAYNSVFAPFNASNLVVTRIGTGSGALSSSATTVFLDEYTTTGTLVQSIALPTADSGSNQTLTLSGSAASEGALNLSTDGRYLTIAGYDAAPGTPSVVSASGIDRIVARVDANGNIDTTTRINDAYSANNIRSAVTDDGTRFWTGGTGTGGGTRFVNFGSTGTSTQISTTVTNTRVVDIFNAQLYTSSASGSNIGVNTVGTGLPTTGGQTTTLLPGLPTNSGNPYAYVLLDRDAGVAGVDTLYIADQGSGLVKYSYNGTTWTARGTVTGTLTGLTGVLNGNNVDLYATNGTTAGNTLVKFTDSTAFNANLTGSFTPLATAGTNTVFRGLDFAPVANPFLNITVNPNTFSEGAGANAATGTVTRTGSAANNLSVTLNSNDTSEATVPATVTIPVGALSATFGINAVDDLIVDGPQTVTLTAAATNYTTGSIGITVTDNDLALQPDLTISQTDSPDPVTVGNALTYTLTVSNSGAANASGIAVDYILPNGVTFNNTTVSNGFIASQSGNTVTFSGGTINAGSSADLTVNVTPTTVGTLTSGTATVDPNNTIVESNEGNNTAATIATTVNAAPTVAPTIQEATATPFVNLPTTTSGAVSGVINDPTDPATTLGIDFSIADADTPVNTLTVTATSSNASVVPDANLTLSGSGASRNLKINPTGVGFADITVSVNDGTNTSSYVINYAASAASNTPTTSRFHTGTSDASTAIAIDSGFMFVADDEDQTIRLYDRNDSGLPLASFDFTSSLGLTDVNNSGVPREVDIEASTRLNDTIYWLGSHSNSSGGSDRPNRERIFSTQVSGSGSNSSLAYQGRYDFLEDDLIAWDNANGGVLGLQASAANGVLPETTNGFNIEGLTLAPNNTTAYVSFRAPVEPTTNRTQALIVPVTNFTSILSPTGGTAGSATFGAPIQLDLGGRGIRSIDRNSTGQYLIVAGSSGSATGTAPNDFRFYSWTGNSADAPILRTANLIALNTDGSFESIVEVPDNLTSTSQIQLLVDNGDTVWYNNGTISKDLAQDNFQKFRSDVVTLGGSTSIIINEIDSDTPGTDAAEFVELYDGGVGNTDLTGLTVVFYNGDNNDQSYAAFDLDGFSTDANGYFVLGNSGVPSVDVVFAGNVLQNGADAVALYRANASDFPNNTPLTTTNLVDAIVYDTNDADDAGLLTLLNSGQPQVNEAGGANGSANDSLQRVPNGAGGAGNTSTYQALPPTPGAVNATVPPGVTITQSGGNTAVNEAGQTTDTYTIALNTTPTGSVTIAVAASDGQTQISTDGTTFASSVNITLSSTNAQTITVQAVDDALVESSPHTGVITQSITSSGDPAYSSISIPNINVSITDNDGIAVSTRIRDIQGAAHISPLRNQTVSNVPGIVTALRSNGFYYQDPNPDTNDATSEGIFVFTSSAPAVSVGASVLVSGTVTEFRPGNNANNLTTTEITSPTITTLSTGNVLPAAIVLGNGGRTIPTTVIEDDASNVETSGVFDPAQDGIDFYESLEGMVVQVNNPVAVSPTNSFGEIWLLADNGANATGRTARGGIVISQNDFNPERIQIDDTLVNLPTVNVGAQLSTITGVVDYNFSNFEVLPTSAPTVIAPSPLTKEVTNLTSTNPDKLTVATFNVENLDPGDGADKFNSLASAIVNNLQKPDIISLEEIQDNNGPTNDSVVDASQTFQTLINAIAAAGGPTYQFRQINPVDDTNGGEPGGNIRVGFLFNPNRVSFIDRPGGTSTSSTTVSNANGSGVPLLSDSPGLIDPTNSAFNSSRKPLVGEFAFNGQSVYVVGNHFNSKGGDQPLFGPNQPPTLSSETQRNQQATIVKNFVQNLLAVDPNANVVVAGDLNDFEFSNPVNTVESAGLTNLIETLPANERYTYNFEGNAQTLDHILVSSNLNTNTNPAEFDVVHINSEFADQISDHDPSVARFNLPSIRGTSGRDTLAGGDGNDTIIGGAGADMLMGGAGNDKFVYTSIRDRGDRITDFEVGNDKIVLTQLLSSLIPGGYGGTNAIADGYVQVVQGAGANIFRVRIDSDGSGTGDSFRQFITVNTVGTGNLNNASNFVF